VSCEENSQSEIIAILGLPSLLLIKSLSRVNPIGGDGSLRVRSDQCSGPGGTVLASCSTAAVIPRQVSAPS
jgi:hypothetical protein